MIRFMNSLPIAACGLFAVLACSGPAPEAPERTLQPLPEAETSLARRVALTFDDLPGVYLDTSIATARDANTRILASLTRSKVHATGFVNESRLRSDAWNALLSHWLDAGMDLGNHTWSHPDLHTTPLASFEQEIIRGERVTRALLKERGRVPRYFRHPFLHTGRSTAIRDSLNAFLAQHGYTVAPVTIDNYDYLFARAHERARQQGRPAEADSVTRAYVAYMDTIFGYYEAQSRAHFNREPQHVLLLHVSLLNAAAMDDLLDMMRRRGYDIVPLDEALTDPIYASADNYAGAAGMTWLHRWAITAGAAGSAFAGEPPVPVWIDERSRY